LADECLLAIFNWLLARRLRHPPEQADLRWACSLRATASLLRCWPAGASAMPRSGNGCWLCWPAGTSRQIRSRRRQLRPWQRDRLRPSRASQAHQRTGLDRSRAAAPALAGPGARCCPVLGTAQPARPGTRC